MRAGVTGDDLATLIYTSGTTGHPKGVQLTHHAVMFTAQGVREVIEFPVGSRVISWLPAAHIAERMAHHYIPVIYAGNVTCAPNPREVLSYLPGVRPNWFFAVPRIWEKLKAGLETMQAAQPEEQRKPVQEALAAATERVRLRQQGKPVPPELEAQVAKADEELFSKLRQMLGLDQLVAVNVGAAPTPGRGGGVLPRHRDRAGRAVGHVRDVRDRHLQPARPGQDRQRGAGVPGRRDQARRRRRGPVPR